MMTVSKCCGYKQLLASSMLLAGLFTLGHASAQGLDSGSIQIVPNSTATPSAAETVTMGIPFAACTVTGAGRNDQFLLRDESGVEVDVFVKETMTWPVRGPCGVESTRALKVQFVFDATGGSKEYSWELTGRTTANDLGESPITEVLTALTATKGSLMEPRVYAIHDPEYLVQTGLVTPTTAVPDVIPASDSYDSGYYPRQFELRAQDFDYTTSGANNWLFDRASTIYRQALRRGEIDHYREAYLAHEFWINRVEDDNLTEDVVAGSIVQIASQNDCVGGFDMVNVTFTGDPTGDSKAGDLFRCDSKYIYLEPWKLHLALTGDDSWTPDANPYANTRDEMVRQMASLIFEGTNRAVTPRGTVIPEGFYEPYDNDALDSGYTERKTGMGLQVILDACELTADTTLCALADTSIDNIYDHAQNTVDGVGVTGYLSHSWRAHEGLARQWTGILSDVSGNTIEISQTIGDLAPLPGTAGVAQPLAPLRSGSVIRLSNQFVGNDYTLTADAIDLGGGVWQIQTDSPVTDPIGDPVYTDDYNMLSDRAFSPWMMAQVATVVWQYYNWTEDAARKQKAAELLQGFGSAIVAYSLDDLGGRLTPQLKTLIETNYSVEIPTIPDSVYLPVNCSSQPLNTVPNLRYGSSANFYTDSAPGDPSRSVATNYDRYIQIDGGTTSDTHTPEAYFMVAVSLFFETDPGKRATLLQYLEDAGQWFDSYLCTATAALPPRGFNWQNRVDPFGTYKWVTSFALDYDTDTFAESLANDGSIADPITITIGGAQFANKAFVEGVDYSVTNLPAGFTGTTLTYIDANTVELSIDGQADDSLPADNIADLTFELRDGALDNFDAARIIDSTKSDLKLEFRNPEVSYSGTDFFESTDNDGSSSVAITIDLEFDTFTTAAGAFPGGDFSISGLPSGLSASLTANSNTQAVLTLTGNASPNGTAANTSGINFAFNDSAFTTAPTAASVTNSSETFAIVFFEPALSYGGTLFSEDAASNAGAIDNFLTVTLSDDTFTVPDGDMIENTHFTTSNVPAGLSVVVTGTSSTTATVSLSGNANNHANADEIADLTIEFLPAAFTATTSVASVPNASQTLSIEFVEPALSYSSFAFSEDASLNNGSIDNSSPISISLVDDTFTVPAGSMALNTHYSVSNVPPGLSVQITGTSATTATLSLTGSATNNGNIDEINNLGIVFLPAAFTNSASTANLTNASRFDFSVSYVEPVIMYSGTGFTEDTSANDGSIANTLTLDLSDDTFVNAGSSLVENTHYQVSNLPPGLALNVDINGTGTQAIFTLSGNANPHVGGSSVADFSIIFLDAAFATSPADTIGESMRMDLSVTFVGDGLNFLGSGFVETDNTGATTDVIDLVLIADNFVVSGGVMTLDTHYSVANVPDGMTAIVTGTSATTATFELTGTATDGSAGADVSDLTLTFLDAAFTGGDASLVDNSSRSNLVVDFRDGEITYNAVQFNESAANNGTMGNSLILTLSEDTFVISGGAMTLNTHFAVSNVPAGLTPVVTGTSATTATFALAGTATSSDDSDDVSNLTLTFLDAAFGGGDASEVIGASTTDLLVDFVGAAISYGSTTFFESGANNGAIGTVLNLTLSTETFTVTSGAMTSGVHYTVSNLPAGLTLVVSGTSATSATVAITGSAANHASANNVGNLTLNFLNAAFNGSNAALVSGASRSDLSISFSNPSSGGGGGGGGSGGSIGGSSGISGTQRISGAVSNLVINESGVIENEGYLLNPINNGRITGGVVSGLVTNGPDAVLDSVTLEPGTMVTGGRLTGSLRGSGTIMDAIVDADEIDEGIILGRGTRITADTARNVPGLDLTAALRNDDGSLNLSQPIFVEDSGRSRTLLETTLSPVNSLFGNDVSEIEDEDGDGVAQLDNPALGNASVVMRPSRVETTAEPDGVRLTNTGELVIVNGGLKTTLQPSPYDAEAFRAAIDAAGANRSELEDGLVFIGFQGNEFAFEFSYVASDAVNDPGAQALNGPGAVISESGSIADPATYKIVITFPDGVTQELIPAIHDMNAFSAWMNAAGFEFVIDSLTGIITITDGTELVFRGIPEYLMRAPEPGSSGVDFSASVDINGDGIGDVYFDTESYRQVIFGLPN